MSSFKGLIQTPGGMVYSEWISKSPQQVMADLRKCLEAFRVLEEIPFYGHSGPPNIQPIRSPLVEKLEAEGPPTEGPDEIKAKAKARAVAIFGPKRGRWK